MKWCEHCRDHFEVDHYDDEGHRAGFEFGPVGSDLIARDIVRDLAGLLSSDLESGDLVVACCSGIHEHSDVCPYRRAREWVEATDT